MPPRVQYFENMSEAMAKKCRGEVVIMTQTPTELPSYEKGEPRWPNIWASKERPALLASIRDGLVTRVLVVDYNNHAQIRAINLENFADLGEVQPSDLLSRDLHANETVEERMLRRDACLSSGLAQRLAAGDPFADRYDLFHVQP